MVITTGGIVIRIPLSQVSITGRNTQGVRIIKLEEKQHVSSIAIVPHEEQEETETEEVTEVKEETAVETPVDPNDVSM